MHIYGAATTTTITKDKDKDKGSRLWGKQALCTYFNRFKLRFKLIRNFLTKKSQNYIHIYDLDNLPAFYKNILWRLAALALQLTAPNR